MRDPRTSPTSAARRPRGGRGGAVLALYALLVFALLALAAAVVDLGFARLTQEQMQNAVDGAALEGQYQRDVKDEFPYWSDPERRDWASEIVRYTFDDDLDPDNGDLLGLTVGPRLRLSGGLGSSNASALLEVDDTAWLDDPSLQGNTGNLVQGDVVSGTYDPNQPHVEQADYTRPDFTAGADGSPDDWWGEAFLVRMRRAGWGSGAISIPGVASSGPGVPLLFGMGAPISGAGGFEPRVHGLTVRATAIASARPAWRVGEVPLDANGQPFLETLESATYGLMLGRTPFCLDAYAWLDDTILLDEVLCVRMRPNGEIVRLDADDNEGEVIGLFASDTNQVGKELVREPTPLYVPQTIEGLTPLYVELSGVLRVVGFGHAKLSEPAAGDPDCSAKTVQKRITLVPITGASAIPLEPMVALSDDDWAEIHELRRQLFTPERTSGTVLAPVIAR